MHLRCELVSMVLVSVLWCDALDRPYIWLADAFMMLLLCVFSYFKNSLQQCVVL